MSLATHLTESPPGRWTYREWRPAHLVGLVELLWYYRGPTMHTRKRIFPNGRVELLVNLGEPYRTVQGAGIQLLTAGCFSGLQTAPMVIEQPAWQDILGVRLSPSGAHALLASPMREVTGLDFNLRDLFGRAADEL